MENIINEFKKSNAVGARFIISTNDEVLENISYGYSNKESLQKVDSKTKFRIASISKTILSIGLMKLVEEKKIDLDEDISLYLGFKVRNPNFLDKVITVKMLTLQTSSILDGYDDENPENDSIIKGYNGLNSTILDVSLEELLTNKDSIYYTSKTFANYPPGKTFSYSNFGCGILACIIEKVSNKYYVDYMNDILFKPLNIDASFKSKLLKDYYNIASMYSSNNIYNKERFINSKLPVFSLGNNYRGSAGGLFINIEDLNKIMQMFLNYGTINNIRILKRETVEYMYQIHSLRVSGNYHAKGIQMKALHYFDGLVFRGHTGGAYGVRSYMFFNLKEKIGATFITNGLLIENESNVTNDLFYNTLNYVKEKYVRKTVNKVIIKEKEIHLVDRIIKDNNLFQNGLIKATCLSDLLDCVFLYNEDSNTLKINHNNLEYVPKVEIINEFEYLNLFDVLDFYKISYQKDSNDIILFV